MDKTAKKVLKKDKANKKWLTTPTRTLLIACASLLVLAGVAMLWTSFINANELVKEEQRVAIISSGVFHDGITVNDVSISGLTMEQAKSALAPIEDTLCQSVSFVLRYGFDSFALDADDIDFTLNTEAILEEAITLGRSGGLLKLSHEVNSYKNIGRDYTIEYLLNTDGTSELMRSLLSASIEKQPVNAALAVKDGLETNYKNIVENYPFIVKAGENGLSIDYDALNTELSQRMNSQSFGAFDIPTIIVEPELDEDDVRDTAVLRAVFSTDFSSSSYNRQYNVRKAAGRCNEIVLQPGEVFSCNEIIGPRTEAGGWLPAPAVVDGGARTEDQAGGGVCQVSTTMYDCVVMSDLEIVYRRNHSSRSTYVRGGLDATINTGTIDFLWKNNTSRPVFLFMWTTKGILYAAIYAESFPDDFTRIEFVSKLSEEIAPEREPTYRTHRSLPEGFWAVRNEAKTGYKYESFKKYYNGDDFFDEQFVAESTYPAIAKCYYVWPGYKSGDFLDPAKKVSIGSDGQPIFGPEPTEPVGETLPPVPPTPGI